MKIMTKTAFTIGLLALLMVVPAFGFSINGSVKIAPGAESSGESSVNGSITVGSNAVVTGDLETVNGSIRVDSGARIEDAETVNGSVKLDDNVMSESLSTVNGKVSVGESSTIDGHIETVNGSISVKRNSSVSRGIANVNGKIDLSGVQVGSDVRTESGDIEIMDGTVVMGDLIVEKSSSWGWGNKNRKTPRVVIGPGSSVQGNIVLEREVEIFISSTASVGGVTGVMSMDQAIRFDGAKP